MAKQRATRLQKVNDGLTWTVVLLAAYIILAPLFPQFTLWWSGLFDHNDGLVYASNLATPDQNRNLKPVPKENTLVIPRLRLNKRVHEGADAATLARGLWRRPHTSMPDRGGNTVIAGHRFTYSSPAIFYHLDKLKVGDKIALFWDKTEYNYEVQSIRIVDPGDVEVERPTDEPTLTLYTCTPLWTSRQRLVVQARLLEKL